MELRNKANLLIKNMLKPRPDKTEETILKKNTNILLTNFPLLFSYVNEQPTFVREQPNWTDIQYTLNLQILIEDAVNMLENEVNAKLLYAFSEKEGKIMQAVMYTKPIASEMNIFLIRSDMFGVIDKINISVFDDIITMYNTLKKDLDLQMQLRRHFMELQSNKSLITDFI